MEIVVVLAIIGVIMAVAVQNLSGAMGHADKTTAQNHINQITTALIMYKSDGGYYPTQKQGLDALVNKPRSAPIPRRWTKANVPATDPWGNPYVYKFPGTYDKSQPEVISMGPNGVLDGDKEDSDDISSQDNLRPSK